MTVAITAIFPTLETAQAAAGCMAVCPERRTVQLSLEHCDTGAISASGRMLHGMRPAENPLDITPTGHASAMRGSCAILRIRCSEQLEGFVSRELAALGAEKITVTTPS